MLACLCASLVTLVFYYGLYMIAVTNIDWTCDSTSSFDCVQVTIIYLPQIFLANAVLLNINKWIYFTMKIFAFIRVGFGLQEKAEKNETGYTG